MNLKERIKSMSFWAGIVGAVILVLGAFGVEIADETANTIVNAVCSLLVVLGIVSPVKTHAAADGEDDSGSEDNNGKNN